MLFSSIVFLFYFLPIVFLLYYAVSFSRMLQNIVLLLASLVFYAWGEPVYVLIMIGSIILNSFFGWRVERTTGRTKKSYLIIAIIANISVLFVFKYLGFVLKNIGLGSNEESWIMNLSLPIGISFLRFRRSPML